MKKIEIRAIIIPTSPPAAFGGTELLRIMKHKKSGLFLRYFKINKYNKIVIDTNTSFRCVDCC